jgi:hypothetical protein
LIHEPQEGFMHERRRLQGVVGALPAEVVTRQATEFVVNQRHHPFERRVVAVVPVCKELSYFARTLISHFLDAFGGAIISPPIKKCLFFSLPLKESAEISCVYR